MPSGGSSTGGRETDRDRLLERPEKVRATSERDMLSSGSETCLGSVSGGVTSLRTSAKFSLGTTAALGAATGALGTGLGLGAPELLELASALRGVRGGDLPRLGEADSDRSTFCQVRFFFGAMKTYRARREPQEV